ncbi:MAG: hypothetical protein KGJ13_09900, partial [Patescibacteria group bacterium]|nr:hypothetical protein [Patescibacteria group bacterium]
DKEKQSPAYLSMLEAMLEVKAQRDALRARVAELERELSEADERNREAPRFQPAMNPSNPMKMPAPTAPHETAAQHTALPSATQTRKLLSAFRGVVSPMC